MTTTTESLQAESGSKFLTFDLAGGVYGIPILNVREIIAMQPVTPLPRMPDAIQGVINLRGKIIPVLDLRSGLGLDAGEHDRATCVIVLDLESADQTAINIGCVVNAVAEVSSVLDSDIQEAPSVGNQLNAGYILGLAKPAHSEHVVTLLNMPVVLADFVQDMCLDSVEPGDAE